MVLKEEGASQTTILHTDGLVVDDGELISFIPEDFDFDADYARDRKRRRTGRLAREWSVAWRNDPTEYLGAGVWQRIWNTAVDDAGLPFRYTPRQVRHMPCRRYPGTLPRFGESAVCGARCSTLER